MATTLIKFNGLLNTIKVRFKGIEYWLLSEECCPGRALAPLDHCDREGNPICYEDSYAHLCRDGKLMRYGEQIGTEDDLEIVV